MCGSPVGSVERDDLERIRRRVDRPAHEGGDEDGEGRCDQDPGRVPAVRRPLGEDAGDHEQDRRGEPGDREHQHLDVLGFGQAVEVGSVLQADEHGEAVGDRQRHEGGRVVGGGDHASFAVAGPRERRQGDADDRGDGVQDEVGRGRDRVAVDARNEHEHGGERSRWRWPAGTGDRAGRRPPRGRSDVPARSISSLTAATVLPDRPADEPMPRRSASRRQPVRSKGADLDHPCQGPVMRGSRRACRRS